MQKLLRANLLKIPKKLYKIENLLDSFDKINSEISTLSELYTNSDKISLDDDYTRLIKQQFQIQKKLELILINAFKKQKFDSNQKIKLFSNSLYFEDPDASVSLQIIPGSGGQEAKIFSTQLFEMYCNISQNKGWELNQTGENSATISGKEVLKILSYETGIHRVQRIPETEKKGRMQTSSAAVTILPNEEAAPIILKESELLIETMRSSGHGGQSVNKSETAVRVTHIPTGILVTMKEASGQIENKNLALKALSEKLMQISQTNIAEKGKKLKAGQRGTLDRSEKIRTFNFEHDKVTDHRCNISVSGVEEFLSGNESFDVFHKTLSKSDDEKVSNYVASNIEKYAELLE